MQIRVLCVDDHPLIRDGVAYALQSQDDIELVANASTGREALALYQQHRPDVTLMDLKLPDLDGIDVMLRIREAHPNARFVVLTTYGGDVQAARALKAGANGYLLKSMLRNELVDTIRAVHSGQRRITAEVASAVSEHMYQETLTARETDILRRVASCHSNKSVAAALNISEETVKGHMKSILGKLDASDRTHAVLIAIKRGILDS